MRHQHASEPLLHRALELDARRVARHAMQQHMARYMDACLFEGTLFRLISRDSKEQSTTHLAQNKSSLPLHGAWRVHDAHAYLDLPKSDFFCLFVGNGFQGRSSYVCLEAIFLSFAFWMSATNWRSFFPRYKSLFWHEGVFC